MKKNKQKLIYSIILVVFLGVASVFRYTDSNTSVSTNVSNNLVKLTNRSSYTTWTEEAYPNFYRIVGKAIIDVDLKEGQVRYSNMDALGRSGRVAAKLNYQNFIYGQRERENISHTHPSGWNDNEKVKIRFLDGKVYNEFFYNRSHLLAHSLGGVDKYYNLITGTYCQNVGKNDNDGGMEHTEMLAYKYLKTHKKGYVYYIATPIYRGSELVARSVIVDIKSDDNTIDEEVEVFNATPGYEIDYATGKYTKK